MNDQTPSGGIPKQTLVLLIGCVLVLMIIVAAVGLMDHGIDRQTAARAFAELENLDDATVQIDAAKETVKNALEEEPEIYKAEGLDATWKTALAAATDLMTEATKLRAPLEKLLDENDSKTKDQVVKLSDQLADARVGALLSVSNIEQTATEMLAAFRQQVAQTKTQAEAELRAYDKVTGLPDVPGELATIRKEVEKALVDESELFGARNYDKTWPVRFDDAQARLKDSATTRSELQTLLKDFDKKKRQSVSEATQKLAAARILAIGDAKRMQHEAKQLITFKKELDERLPKIKTDYEAIQQIDLSGLNAKVQKAVTDWPAKKSDLEARLKRYTEAQNEADTLWKTTEAASTGKGDVTQLLKVGHRLTSILTLLAGANQQLPKLIEQLNWSWDKILADMEVKDGHIVIFRQKFKTVKVRALVAEKDDAAATSTEQWTKVTRSTFEKLRNNLGMVVEHKPAGKYDHESTRMVQPAGYAYMCPPEQQRNRYGRWERRSNGTSFWVFYGQYSLMRNLMGLGRRGYSPINGGMYRDYRTYSRSGRSYYGRDEFGRNRYGSRGIVTAAALATTLYVTSGGFKKTKYVSSGGKYRGSRYTPKPSPSRARTNTTRPGSSASRSRTNTTTRPGSSTSRYSGSKYTTGGRSSSSSRFSGSKYSSSSRSGSSSTRRPTSSFRSSTRSGSRSSFGGK